MTPVTLALVSLLAAAPAGIRLADEQVVRKSATVELPFELPAVPPGQQVRLALRARVSYSCWCANNPAMTAAVNGKPVLGRDLLNKPLEYHAKNGRDAFWATPGGSSWLLFSWPDFSVDAVKAFESPYAITEVDPFAFVWDITPYVAAGRNVASFTHPEITGEDHTLVLRDVRVEVGTPLRSANEAKPAPAPVGELPSYVPRGRQTVPMRAWLARGGAIRFQVGRRTLTIASRTSEPEGRWAATSGGEWQPVAIGQTVRAGWSPRGYQVSRSVTRRADHLLVSDTYTNTTGRLIGVMHEHLLSSLAQKPSRNAPADARPVVPRVRRAKGKARAAHSVDRLLPSYSGLPEKPLDVKLGGRPHYAPVQSDCGGANPTALARWGDLAVGLAAEDDVFRVHAKELASPDAVGLADHELGITAGESRTLAWSIYPVPGGDYWDFINAVRRNWGANFTIPGPFAFVDWPAGDRSDAYYRDWVQRRGVQMVASFDAMFDEGKAAMGTAIPLAKQFCARTACWIRQLHSVAPGVKAVVYMNCTLCTEPGAPEKYADSKLMGPDGTQRTAAAGSPQGVTMAPLFISTPGNSYGQAMMRVARWIVEELGADGLYHDVLSASDGYGSRAYPERTGDGSTGGAGEWGSGGVGGTKSGSGRSAMSLWDGCTVAIDPKTHAVTGKAFSVALLQRGWHTALAKYLRERRKVLVGNCPVETRTHLDLHIPVFVETCFSYSTVIDTHLGSPWGYANHPVPDPGRGFYANAAYSLRRILEYGGILALPGWQEEPKGLTFLHLLTPITPLEIRAGMVLGKERIVTSRSGRYGWPDGSAADVYVFDGDGARLADPPVRQVGQGRRRLYEIRMPGDHFAILVRRKAECGSKDGRRETGADARQQGARTHLLRSPVPGLQSSLPHSHTPDGGQQ